MIPDAWFRQNDGPWHLGQAYGRCGERNDPRISRTDLRPKAERRLSEWCRECYADRDEPYVGRLRDEIAESQAELDEHLRTVDARLAEWDAANRSEVSA